MRPWFGTSLIGKEGEEWQQRRLMIQHVFQAGLLEQFMEIFVNHSNELIENLENLANDRKIFDIYENIYETVLNITIDAVVGSKARMQFDEAVYVRE